MLNLIWSSFFLISFVAALYQAFWLGQTEIWGSVVQGLFSAASNAFIISINLTGMLCLWLGLLKIAEQSGLTNLLAKLLNPFFRRVMPEVPADHPSIGSIVMNMAANMLGLDNAATPMGIRAMEQLQDINRNKETASNAQILFMVINSSAVTLIPINILIYRTQLGSENPAAVFIPILLATSVSTLAGFLAVAFVQKLRIFNRVVMTYLLGFLTFIAVTSWYFSSLDNKTRLLYSSTAANFTLFFVIIFFIIAGLYRRIKVYDIFIKGAKDGFQIAVQIIPYLVAMLTAIAVLRESGVMDIIISFLDWAFRSIGMNTDFIPALPTALMKPLSGSGAKALMLETMQTYGADSFAGFVSCIVQGSTETTFYVLAVYFGAVKITKTRHALPCALLADAAGVIAAIVLAYIFY